MWRGVDKTTHDIRFIISAVIHKDFDEDTTKTGLPTGQGSFSDCCHSILQILIIQEEPQCFIIHQHSLLNTENLFQIPNSNKDEATRKFLVSSVFPKSNTKFPPLSLFQI